MSADRFFLGVAGFVFKVQPMYEYVKTRCGDYILPEPPEGGIDGEISINDHEIEAEIRHADFDVSDALATSRDALYGYFENHALFRKVAEAVSLRDAAVFHGVLLELNGEGYLFTAKSGTGKTTHAMNWLKAFPDARIINGDKPILRIEHDRLMGYGTPWCGKEHYQFNEKVPVKAVIWLKRGETNEIREISACEMITKWIAQTYQPSNEDAEQKRFDLIIAMMDKVKMYSLHCTMDPESAFIAEAGMRQGT